MIRDTALAASGLLNDKIGGPSVLPYQPAGLWEEMAFGEGFSAQKYVQSHGPDLYRRGMYTFWKRTVPPASLATFDAPDREKCTARRAFTNTPLQALVLMNDPTYVEAARALAQRSLLEGGSDESARIAYAFRLATARKPSRQGNRRAEEPLNSRARRVRARIAAPRPSSSAVGESARDARLDVAELAAWTTVASARFSISTRRSPSSKQHGMTHRHRQRLDLHLTRRQLFGLSRHAASASAALASLLGRDVLAAPGQARDREDRRPRRASALRAARRSASSSCTSRAGRRSSRPFDYKPQLAKYQGTQIPDSVRQGQRVTQTMGQSSLPVAKSMYKFAQHGKSRHVGQRAAAAHREDRRRHHRHQDDVHRRDQSRPGDHVHPDRFQQPGRPSMGAWLSYGLGSENQNLPSFVVLLSQAQALNADQPLFSRLWGSGFLPSSYQGVRFRSGGEPVLYLDDPPGVTKATRREMLDAVGQLNTMKHEAYGDPEIETRIAQYEMAYRMQTSVPELMDLVEGAGLASSNCTGRDSRKPGTYAANCLLARRLAERDVRFIQLYHRGWDQHSDLPRDIALQCKGTDQPTAALITDLKQRGLLDDTLVIWGGEFGRTVFSQGKLTDDNYGRDHHPRNFCMWVAGGGIKRGIGARRDRRLQLQRRVGSGVGLRPAGHAPAPAGDRPHEADLPLPGPRLPAHRRPRRGRGEDAGLVAVSRLAGRRRSGCC